MAKTNQSRAQPLRELEVLRTQVAELQKKVAESQPANKGLASEEGVWRRITETCPVGIAIVDRDGQITFANARAQQILRLTREEIIQRKYNAPAWHIIDFDGNPSPDDALPILLAIMATGKPVYNVCHAIEWPDGRRVLLSINAAPLTDESGELQGAVATFEDVTERLQAEAELHQYRRQLEDLVADRTTELDKTLRAYRTLSACNQAMVRAPSEAELLETVCQQIIDPGGYRLAWVGFAEHDAHKTVRPVAWAGYEAGYLDTLQITWADSERGRGPTGTAIRTGKPCIAQHILTDPSFVPWREDALRRRYASSIALPLITSEQVLGTLNVYAAEPDAFGPGEIALLGELAGDLAYGITALRTQVERERAEAAWRESQRALATLMSNLPGTVYRCCNDQDWTMQFVSERCYGLTGYHPDALVDNQVSSYGELIHPDDRERIWGTVQAALLDNQPFKITYRIRAKDGRENGCGTKDGGCGRLVVSFRLWKASS